MKHYSPDDVRGHGEEAHTEIREGEVHDEEVHPRPPGGMETGVDIQHGGRMRSSYLVRGDSWVMSTSVLPDTITVSSRHRNTSCSVCIDSYI